MADEALLKAIHEFIDVVPPELVLSVCSDIRAAWDSKKAQRDIPHILLSNEWARYYFPEKIAARMVE